MSALSRVSHRHVIGRRYSRAMPSALTEWLNQELGQHVVVGRPSMTVRRTGTAQRVVQIRDASGDSWYVKRAAVRRAWRAEVDAYRTWVPAALEGRAPELHTAHPGLRALVVSAAPGVSPRHHEVGAVRQAGQLLRRLHDVEVRETTSFAKPGSMPQRLEQLLARNGGLFTAEEEAFARRSAQRAMALPTAPLVACHGDYNRHNWLVDETRTLRVIDFGEATLHRAAFDFAKLFYGPWWENPQPTAAFFKGYGRRPDAHEMEFIQCRMAVSAVAEVCYGRNRGHAAAESRGRSRLTALIAGHQVEVARRFKVRR